MRMRAGFIGVVPLVWREDDTAATESKHLYELRIQSRFFFLLFLSLFITFGGYLLIPPDPVAPLRILLLEHISIAARPLGVVGVVPMHKIMRRVKGGDRSKGFRSNTRQCRCLSRTPVTSVIICSPTPLNNCLSVPASPWRAQHNIGPSYVCAAFGRCLHKNFSARIGFAQVDTAFKIKVHVENRVQPLCIAYSICVLIYTSWYRAYVFLI